MEDEIVRLNKYDKFKSTTKKKSLAEMVDEVILEKESIFFNPDNKPLKTHQHHFEGDTPSRGTIHSRATFDPFSISPIKERMTSSNNFIFKEFWDKKRKDGNNMTFGSLGGEKAYERETLADRLSFFTPNDIHASSRLKSMVSPPRDSKIGIEKDINEHEKSHKKMDNVSVSLLSQLSNTYYDDYDRRIMQRFYLLVHGEPTAIDAQFSVNIFKKSEREKTDLKLSIIIRNVFLEYTNDWVKNIAKAVLAYKLENIHNRFSDITIRPDKNMYQRKLEFHTMLMYLTKRNFENFKRNFKKDTSRSDLDDRSNPDIDDDWKSRKQYKKDKNLQRQLITVDKVIKDVNFKITFKLDEFRLDGLTDIDSIKYKYKRHIFQIKTDPMIIRVLKQGLESGVSGFGVTFTTRNSLEMLCQFLLQLKKSISIYTDNPVIKKGIRFYKEIVMNQVTRATLKKSQSAADTSVRFGSALKGDYFKLDDSKIGGFKMKSPLIEERKSAAGPKLFQREFEPDKSLDNISDIKATPEPIKSSSRLTPATEDPAAGQLPSKEKRKKKRSKKRSKSPNESKKIQHMVIKKN